MLKRLSRILIATLTFMVGFAASVAVEKYSFEPTYGYEVFIAPPGPRFTPFGRGCGNGYVQAYDTNDGHRVSEGVTVFESRREAKKEFSDAKREADRIIEVVRNYRDHQGNVGERVVGEWVSDDGSERGVSILFYDADDSYSFIDAPSLDLALEFEQYLISIDYRSPF